MTYLLQEARGEVLVNRQVTLLLSQAGLGLLNLIENISLFFSPLIHLDKETEPRADITAVAKNLQSQPEGRQQWGDRERA